MTLTWGPWRADPSADPGDPDSYATPYGDWYESVEFPLYRSPADWSTTPQPGMSGVFPGLPLPRITLPRRALPPDGQINVPEPRPAIGPGLPGALTRESVIVGVIDAAVALAHDRFRRPGGGTRILSAWSQGGTWQGQAHLPFGRELMQGDIDGLMAASGHGLGVDEGVFNRQAGLADYVDPASERWIDTSAPHGTHVADLAAGYDPGATGTLRDRMPMIVVDLAPRASVGPSGSFLEYYVLWAIRHIAATADAIWDAKFGKDDPQGQNGFAVVINLSYGLSAGPKDGTMALQKYVAGLNAARAGRPPLVLVLPAGNDNLEEVAAKMSVDPGCEGAALNWRISPEDHTSNYAEVWSDPLSGPPTPGALHPLAIAVSPPGGPAGPGTQGAAGQVCDLIQDDGTVQALIARIYCRQTDNALPPALPGQATCHRLHYVVCTRPTFAFGPPAAPAGAWTITLSNDGKGAAPARLYVQSDQDLTPGTGLGRLSHFEDPAYEPYDAAGRVNDSYHWDLAGAVMPSFGTGPVLRRDAVNAIAGGVGTLTIGGYRRRDGLPADYSSAGDDPRPACAASPHVVAGGDPWPDWACTSDDGVWRTGRLAAGGRSGSAAVLQGTSFATGEATRIVAGDLIRQLDAGVPGPSLQVAGPGFAATVPDPYPVGPYPFPATAMPFKLGAERLPVQDYGRVQR